ncbi:sigma-70 family RNA polymerase sigma factor [Nocardiopsis sp. EMB25]|uniref:sigma-70 family RNA polymerase sigma factor n=1 Tax=Nocardiopsis sp. EMB25 TaxID=2835867 RepID=UPI0022844D35|nr:sigma-70 family RNA polymerase sigma factor [Nocardiopsis sp. EMB25]MCY9787123.1 sigma-70 family RNA polymerase sigma factor [Nocardiopsis sp. EMB25]
MACASSPLAVVETEFVRLSPTHLTLHGSEIHPWLQDRAYSLFELREVLMTEGTPYDVRDHVWRHTIRAARRSQDWMVGALGLCMPALRTAARRACRGLPQGSAREVESAILAETIRQVRTINTDYARLAWYLTRPAHRAALSARRREREAPAPTGDPSQRIVSDRDAVGNPDLLLIAAVRVGVLSAPQAQLIARTRLEKVSLAQVADELGVSYKACAKRRERAEERLVAAVHAGEVAVGDALLDTAGVDRTPPAEVVSMKSGHPLSHRPWPVAS